MAANITIDVSGFKKIGELIDRYGKAAAKECVAQLFKEGEGIMAQSKEIVPVDTGTLRGTGHVRLPKFRGGSVVIELVYGGPAAPYALIIHEELGVTVVSGQPKYLEMPAKAAANGMGARIAKGMFAGLRAKGIAGKTTRSP